AWRGRWKRCARSRPCIRPRATPEAVRGRGRFASAPAARKIGARRVSGSAGNVPKKNSEGRRMSRRYFGTDGMRGRVGEEPITPQTVLKLGWAAGRVLGRAGGGEVLIGKDTRVSGYLLESALEAGLSAAGMDIALLGPMPTPGIAYLTRTARARAGIVISASHNQFEDNGNKFFSPDGTKLPDEQEAAIEAAMSEPLKTVGSSELGKAERVPDAAGRYIEFCKSTIPHRLSLKGMTVVVDCANGAAYHVAPNVFAEMGADVV